MAERLDEVRAIIARYPVSDPRVFGSVARGEDDEKSDLDLLADAAERATRFDLSALEDEPATLLGVSVDVLTPGAVGPEIAESARRDLRPLRWRAATGPGHPGC